MKKYIFILFFSLPFILLYGQEEDNSLKIGGELLSDQRFLLKSDNDWIWNENSLKIELEKKAFDNTKFHGQFFLRNFGIPEYNSLSALYNKGIVDPVEIEIDEAYVEVSDFLFPKLDLSIGRQYINWGTADMINPTSNLNPYDFKDLLNFGKHRASDAFRFNYYISDNFSLEGIFIPFFRPANFPVGVFANVFTQAIEPPKGMSIAGFTDTLFLPKQNLKHSPTGGFRFKGILAGFDFSLSYAYVRHSLPMPYNTDITPIDTLGHINVTAKLNYPKQHVIGADFAGSLFGIGVWGEAALHMQAEDVKMTTNIHTIHPVTHMPMVITKDSLLIGKDKPYVKFVLGADYNFANGIYINVQYLHGFIHEYGENLNDYYFARIEKSFFYDKLKIAPISGAFIVTDYSDISNNFGYAYMPEIIYKPTDNLELALSTVVMQGKGKGLFAKIADLDMFMLKATYSF